jgi:large subunit ribosomal protein L18
MKINLTAMRRKNEKKALHEKRRMRVRKKVDGEATKPRLSVFRSAKHIYVQAIDDLTGSTLACASTMDKEVRPKVGEAKKVDAAKVVGELLARRLLAKGVEQAVFDRNGYRYRGRVAAIADAAREAGLKF